MNLPDVSDLVADWTRVPLALGILAAILSLLLVVRSLGRFGAIVLLLLAVAWLPFNKVIEGPTLIEFNDERGLTLADVLTLIAMPLAVWRFGAASRSERAATSDSSVIQGL